ncbi:MAG: iron ABC transporter permease [Anaerolineales bacterium]|nr:iron ABC transporter permease [Anaerolineales bacterium]
MTGDSRARPAPRGSFAAPLTACGLALIGALLLSAGIGAVAIPPQDVARIALARGLGLPLGGGWPAAWETILFSIRLPRTALVALTGAALAGSGAAYQGLFRNPLADPYLIGIASGAGLGAVLVMAWQWPATLIGLATVPAGAFVGALLTTFLVVNLARLGAPAAGAARASVTALILAGVAVGAFASALMTFLMLRSQGELRRAMAWLVGGAAQGGWEPVWAALPYVAAGLTVLVLLARPLNVLQFGEEQAQQLGVDVERLKLIVIVAASLATAAAVAFSGLIGFVGLVVPHIVRLAWGPDYRRLLPLSILAGAAMLLLADVAARAVLAPQEVPVGIITALAGAPFFLWLLRRAQAA